MPGLDAIYGEGAAQLSLSQRTVLLPGITSFKLRTMKLASLGVPGSLRTHRPVGQIRPHLQGRKNLRTAMLSRILLGPPRSMDPNG
ncbi:MAG TPA: hypothetical protein DCZ95_07675 [Verrucomicrobia bacterium]|nr:hypothetical protein [Verrucomicrobiota bacterium]